VVASRSSESQNPSATRDDLHEGVGIVYTQHRHDFRAATPSVRAAREVPGTSLRSMVTAGRAKKALEILPEAFPPATLALRSLPSRCASSPGNFEAFPPHSATLPPANAAVAAKLARAAQARETANRRVIGNALPSVMAPPNRNTQAMPCSAATSVHDGFTNVTKTISYTHNAPRSRYEVHATGSVALSQLPSIRPAPPFVPPKSGSSPSARNIANSGNPSHDFLST